MQEEDEEEMELDGTTDPKVAEELRMRRLMRAMDRELMKTKLAEDFEKVPKPEVVLDQPQEYLLPSLLLNCKQSSMLSCTDIGILCRAKSASGAAEGGDEEDVRPVDLNLNLMKNILSSIEAEEGLAGPSSSLLKELRDLSLHGRRG